MNRFIIPCIILLISVACTTRTPDSLEENFRYPPSSTRPWVYWYWIDENISKEGITADLKAMKKIGIGEALIGHISPGTKRGEVRILSDEWWKMVGFAVSEGQHLGVDIGFFNGPGWSQSGGPWIKADQSMRYLVSNRMIVRGPSVFRGNIVDPKDHFQRVSLQAIPLLRSEATVDPIHPSKVTASPALSQAMKAVDGDTGTYCLFPRLQTANQLLSFDLYLKKRTFIQTIRFHFSRVSFLAEAGVECQDDHGQLRTQRNFTIDRRNLNFQIGPSRFDPVVFSFPPVQTGHVRITFRFLSMDHGAGIKEIELLREPMVDQVIDKQLGKVYSEPQPPWNAYQWDKLDEPADSFLIHKDQVIDLSGRMDSLGNLSWQVPPGYWLILNTGMVPTGAVNVPAPPEATGYECDKFSRQAVETHFDSFIGKFLTAIPDSSRKSLKTVVIDSYEVGPQNWTDSMRNIFMRKLGYDPIPWLPVLAGRIVESRGLSDRFLWDLRRLTADLIAENYVGRLRELSNRYNLNLWLENYGHWGFPAEFLQYGGQADYISGEFWFNNPLWDLGPLECRAASSAAHIYGKKQVFAEAFTAGFNFRQSPGSMKSRGDRMFCQGINHLVMHVYIHQPWSDRKPGVTAWFGMSFQRNNTWFGQSKAWIDYIRRCEYLLQQGDPVADICYFIGEDAPKMTGTLQPSLPSGFDYDFINKDVLLNRAVVKNGLITLPGGKHYRLLILPPEKSMTPEVLEKISQLISEGVAVYGPPPIKSPSLAGYPEADKKILKLAGEIWGDINRSTTSRAVGKGHIYNGQGLNIILDSLGLEPDVIVQDTGILWTHRRSKDLDVYFFSNQHDQSVSSTVSFRINGMLPERWDPSGGTIREDAWYHSENGRTLVPLSFDPEGSIFVIFRRKSDENHIINIRKDGIELAPVSPFTPGNTGLLPTIDYGPDHHLMFSGIEPGHYSLSSADDRVFTVNLYDSLSGMYPDKPWTIYFPKDWDAPDSVVKGKLESWTEFRQEGIKYFSGTALYKNTIEIPASYVRKNVNFTLDLGEVNVMAGVTVNGKDLGVLWKKPFETDVTNVIKPGANSLEIRVTNTWWNRLVGDEKYPEGFPGSPVRTPRTFVTVKAWSAQSDLLASGLLSPVKIEAREQIPISPLNH